MEKLTKQQILTICTNIIRKLKKAQSEGEQLFLDVAIKTEIQNLFNLERWEIEIENFIPEYTLLNAKIMCNAEESEFDTSMWWNGSKESFDYENRIKFIQFIIECQNNK